MHIILHIIAWAFLFVLPVYLLYIDSMYDTKFFIWSSIQVVIYAIIFYFNYLIFVPKLFLKGKKIIYFITVFSFIALMTIATEFGSDSFFSPHRKDRRPQFSMQNPPPPPQKEDRFEKGIEHKKRPSKKWPIYNFMLTSFFISGFGIGLRFSEKLIHAEKQRKEIEKEKLNSELIFLKNQISPHFFFNTLNNIYSLIQIDTDDAQKATLQLSKLMRYLLYESEQGNTLLSREIEFMKSYIDLMKLRLSEKVIVDVDFQSEYTDIVVPPLLFIPFIENAFKHGVSYHEFSFIKIQLNSKGNNILFICENSKTDKEEYLHQGIGLTNIKKRLKLLFPEKHTLDIQKTEITYSVSLVIDLT